MLVEQRHADRGIGIEHLLGGDDLDLVGIDVEAELAERDLLAGVVHALEHGEIPVGALVQTRMRGRGHGWLSPVRGDAGTARGTPERSRCGRSPCAWRAAPRRRAGARTRSTAANPASRRIAGLADLEIGEILADRQDRVLEQPSGRFPVGVRVVAVGGLRRDVPVSRPVARADDVAHRLERARHQRAARRRLRKNVSSSTSSARSVWRMNTISTWR